MFITQFCHKLLLLFVMGESNGPLLMFGFSKIMLYCIKLEQDKFVKYNAIHFLN